MKACQLLVLIINRVSLQSNENMNLAQVSEKPVMLHVCYFCLKNNLRNGSKSCFLCFEGDYFWIKSIDPEKRRSNHVSSTKIKRHNVWAHPSLPNVIINPKQMSNHHHHHLHHLEGTCHLISWLILSHQLCYEATEADGRGLRRHQTVREDQHPWDSTTLSLAASLMKSQLWHLFLCVWSLAQVQAARWKWNRI